MKKLLPILGLALVLAGCKKTATSTPEPEAKKYDVTFTTSGFSSNITTFGTDEKKKVNAASPLTGNVDNLYYRIYNSSGTLVNSIDQASNVVNFGTIADKLPAGTYNVFLGASKGSLYLYTSQTTSFSVSDFHSSTNLWNDTFFSQFPVTVSTTAVSQSVTLNRAIGALDVKLTDAIPSNAARISIIFSSYVSYLKLTGDLSGTESKSTDFTLAASDVGVKNKTFSVNAGATSATTPVTSNLTIRAYDSSNGLITEKTVANVPIYRNKRTAVSGALFPTGNTTSQNTGFTVTVNTTWDTPPGAITF